ncbi:MAG: hypothetical protein E6Q61_05360 [Nitrosomonas sp.]|nr:MAG: hypothetical protein E6Q61_05360 [Nitrosomonas sp.]
MSIQLERFANGDTNYVAKHNNNADIIESAIDSIEQLAGNNAAASGANVAKAFRALFGESASLIGGSSYACTGVLSTLTVQPGYCWRPSLNAVVSRTSTTAISFTGVSAGTWFITADPNGNPIRTADATEAAYSVVWSGSAFGLITRLLPITFGAIEDGLVQTSTALAQTFSSLDARLEAGEAKAAAGDLGKTYVSGRLSKSVAGNSNVTLTSTEANNMILNFTGAVTGNIDINVPLTSAPRVWLVTNNTTGGFKLTFKGSAGSGVILPDGGQAVWLYQDGVNILSLPPQLVHAESYSSSITADFSRGSTIKITLAGNPTITLTGAKDKQKCILELTQDATGSRTITLINHRFGSDLTAITLSTGANLTDKIGFIYDATADKYDVVALLRGF